MKYEDAGVNIDKSNVFEEKLKNIFGDVIGPFGGIFNLKGSTLVTSTDGIGTKLKLEIEHARMDYAAQDLVAMNVNDIFCLGAKPLFFLDYIGCHTINLEILDQFIKSLKCVLDSIECKLLGGETAEMPLIYPKDMIDLVGFVVGEVSTSDGLPLGPQKVKAGDVAIALPSSGPHSNGYTLINKLIDERLIDGSDDAFINALLEPTFIYSFNFVDGIHACAHVTGGGVVENLPRMLPNGLGLDFEIGDVPEVFEKIKAAGKIPDDEMLRTFNMGIGFVLLVEKERVSAILEELKKFNPRIAGKVFEDETGSHLRIR